MKKRIQRIRFIFACFLSLVLLSLLLFLLLPKTLESFTQFVITHIMNLDNADSITKAKILEARNELIYAESWSADGIDAYVMDLEGNVLEKLPEFSELFPADWSVPAGLPKAEVYSESSPYSTTTEVTQYVDSVSLRKPSKTAASKPFRTISTTRYIENKVRFDTTMIRSFTQIVPGTTYNLGYTNLNTGSDLAHKTNMKSGESLSVSPPKNIKVGIRASSYNTWGTYDFITYETYSRIVL